MNLMTAMMFVLMQLDVKIQEITQEITTISRPVGLLALTIAVLMYIAEPVMPEWAKEHKGAIRRVLVGLMVLGALPDLVNLFS